MSINTIIISMRMPSINQRKGWNSLHMQKKKLDNDNSNQSYLPQRGDPTQTIKTIEQ